MYIDGSGHNVFSVLSTISIFYKYQFFLCFWLSNNLIIEVTKKRVATDINKAQKCFANKKCAVWESKYLKSPNLNKQHSLILTIPIVNTIFTKSDVDKNLAVLK